MASAPGDSFVSPPAGSRDFSCLSPGRSRGRCSLVLPFAMRVLSPSEISSLGSGLAGAEGTTAGGGGGAGGAGTLARPVSSFLGGGTGSGDLASRPGSLAPPVSSPGRTLRTTLRTTRTTLRRDSPWPSSPCPSAAGPSSPFTAAPFSTGSGLFPLPGGGSGLFTGSGLLVGSGLFTGSGFGGSAFGGADAASFGLSDCSHNNTSVSGGPASTALWDVVVPRALPCHGAQLPARPQHWGHSTLPHQPTAPQWIPGHGAVVTSLPHTQWPIDPQAASAGVKLRAQGITKPMTLHGVPKPCHRGCSHQGQAPSPKAPPCPCPVTLTAPSSFTGLFTAKDLSSSLT